MANDSQDQLALSDPFTTGMHIGIDIGWSPSAPTCGMVVGNCARPDVGFAKYAGRGGRADLWAKRFKLDDLVDFLDNWRPNMEGPLSAVLDGPIAESGPPARARGIDAACRRGGFNGRCQPLGVHTGDGPTYVAATNRVHEALERLALRAGGRLAFWPASTSENSRASWVAETNPTVGLALLLPHAGVGPLPSRNAPVMVQGRTIRAKSDFYFVCGAGTWLEAMLDVNGVEQEIDHELQAGIYCAAVARRLEALRLNKSGAIALGDEDGVYVFPEEVEKSWYKHVAPLVYRGKPVPIALQWATIAAGAAKASRPGTAPQSKRVEPAAGHKAKVGDEVDPVLNDNGGVWASKNPWLSGLAGYNEVHLDCPGGIHVKLVPAKSKGQWKATPSPLSLAHKAGFKGKHLSSQAGGTVTLRCNISRLV